MQHTDFKQKDMIKLLLVNGWTLKRESKHKIFQKNKSIVSVPHTKTIKRNTARDILKMIEKES